MDNARYLVYNKGIQSIYYIRRKALSMKNHNTKPAQAQAESDGTTSKAKQVDSYDLHECLEAATRFFKRFKVIQLLGECGAYKEKGVPVSVIMLYIFNLMFSPMSMYYQPKFPAEIIHRLIRKADGKC